MVDCHVHIWKADDAVNLNSIRERIGAERMNAVSIIYREHVNDNPACYAVKALYPDKFYVFPGLDHSTHLSGGKLVTPPLAEQVDRMIEAGADGIKLLETKTAERKMVGIPADSDYYADMFARVEEAGLPAVWHVADPEEFWDPELTPKWAKEQGWGYDDTFCTKEQLYTETENVLARHPRLKIIFAHFYFLSADLPRAAALLDRYEDVYLDLAPGVEMLYNMSKNTDEARKFFIKYSDRILFGTDITGDQPLEEAEHRARLITRWLETEDEYRVSPGADFLLGPPEDGIIRGIKLPEDVLAKIYLTNFERLVEPKPRKLDKKIAIEECERIAKEAEALGGDGARAITAADMIRG